MATRKCGLLDTAGQLHTGTHRCCNSLHKNCVGSSQSKFQYEEGTWAWSSTPRWATTGSGWLLGEKRLVLRVLFQWKATPPQMDSTDWAWWVWKQRTQNWMDREGEMDLSHAGGRDEQDQTALYKLLKEQNIRSNQMKDHEICVPIAAQPRCRMQGVEKKKGPRRGFHLPELHCQTSGYFVSYSRRLQTTNSRHCFPPKASQ